MKLRIPRPVSAGVFLSYRCTSECRHCMYACSPHWRADLISEEGLQAVLTRLSESILPSPLGADRVSLNHGLHFTGGEPFLSFELLAMAVEMANKLDIPSVFVETNAFWCANEAEVKEKLERLRSLGLKGILVSVNPFTIEEVPFERTDRAIRIGRAIFKSNTMVYQEAFLDQFKKLQLRSTLTFEEYLRLLGPDGLRHSELLPLGRANYELAALYRKHPAKDFFGESCRESLTREWHVHVDNYGNYVPGYCGGISLGDMKDPNSVYGERDLSGHRVLDSLATSLGELCRLATDDFGYRQLDGYISKCHLCLDMRRHLAQATDEFEELRPTEFYKHLEG